MPACTNSHSFYAGKKLKYGILQTPLLYIKLAQGCVCLAKTRVEFKRLFQVLLGMFVVI